MKKQDLLNYLDKALLEKLFGFCYARTKDSYEAEELCSDIIYALIKASQAEGDIENVYPFIWKVARNVYADFSDDRRKRDAVYEVDFDRSITFVEDDSSENTKELLSFVHRRIAFLTKIYREVMIMFYIDGLSTSEIAVKQAVSEVAVRQRLFSARQKIKSEVEKMTEYYDKPVAIDKIDYVIWGTGSPSWGDPRNVCTRMFSKHIIWLCAKKTMSAAEIADKLNVPTVYVEEELEILKNGSNGKYGLLRRLDNGKYAINFILFDKSLIEKAQALYIDQLPKICDIILRYIQDNKEKYLAFHYLNKKVDLNLILWQQVFNIAHAFSESVECVMEKKYFADTPESQRPFSVFGYVDNGKHYGGGWDGVDAQNVCGFSYVRLDNIYITRIKKHFSCGLNVSRDPQIQMALRAINGLEISTLSERDKECAAKAIECGYLYREGDMLYTKILVNDFADKELLFKISNGLRNGYFDAEAEYVADNVAKLIKKCIPAYLHGEWRFANRLADMPILDAVVEFLIKNGVLIPPEDGIGAEGCWMSVGK